MNIAQINPDSDLSEIVKVLNVSHGTVAEEFGFTRESNPSNNAFIDKTTLKQQLSNGINLYAMSVNNKITGCVAVEKSAKEKDTFYIEKVSVKPEFRHKGYGIELMNFACSKIKAEGGRFVSIALIDSNTKLKDWYLKQGFIESGFKDFEHLPFRVSFMRKEV